MRIAAVLLAALLAAPPAQARDQIRIVTAPEGVGIAHKVALHFSEHWSHPAPFIEATGTGAGLALFCGGVGFDRPDIAITGRPMTASERALCARNGIEHPTEIEVARDALVVVSAPGAPALDLTRRDLFLALAAELPGPEGMTRNRNATWRDVDARLPATPIQVMAPRHNTLAEHAFLEMTLARGCAGVPGLEALDEAARHLACRRTRGDDALVTPPRNTRQAARWLRDQPRGLMVTTYAEAARLGEGLTYHPVQGVTPGPEAIASGRYPLVVGLYTYVKDSHAGSVPGLQQLVYELTSERSLSPEGYLAEDGLVPLDEQGRNRARDRALALGL